MNQLSPRRPRTGTIKDFEQFNADSIRHFWPLRHNPISRHCLRAASRDLQAIRRHKRANA